MKVLSEKLQEKITLVQVTQGVGQKYDELKSTFTVGGLKNTLN